MYHNINICGSEHFFKFNINFFNKKSRYGLFLAYLVN